MNKAQKVYLCISLTVFAILFLIFAIDTIATSMEFYTSAQEGGGFREVSRSMWWRWEIYETLVSKGFFPLVGLSLVKNGYVFLAANQVILKKILCIISSILSISVAILMCSAEWWGNGLSNSDSYLIFIAWPLVIVSFILGCLPENKVN